MKKKRENEIIDVLKIIYRKLKQENIKWVIGGSTSLFLHRIDLKDVADIDIMTTKNDAFKIMKLFKDFEIKPIKFSKIDKIKSYWGQLKIKNIKIDIMGDFCERIGNRWINISRKRLKSPEYIKVGKFRFPVTSLQQHLESYKSLRREKDTEKIKKIEEVLNKRRLQLKI